MSNVIKINNDYEIGEILAKIANAEGDVVLQVSSDYDFNNNKQDIDTIKHFAKQRGKNVNIHSSERFEKLGFVPGEDISSVSASPKMENSKKPSNKSKPAIKLPKIKVGKKAPTILIIVLILMVVGGIYGFTTLAYRLPTAEVSLTVSPEIFTGSKDFVGTEEPNEGEVRVNRKNIEVVGDLKVIATGEKETGEVATGEIELLNKSDDEIEIDSETSVTINYNGEDLTFITTESVSIDGKTEKEVEVDGETTKADVFGSETVNIEATAPGEKYNISNDDIESENISIDTDDSDDLDIELSESTEGGTSEKVTVVSEKDLTELENSLQENLEKEATEKMKESLTESQQLLEGSLNATVTNITYSAEVDEEIAEIEGSMTLKVQALYIDNNDIRDLLNDEIESIVPSNYKVSEVEDNISIVSSVKNVNTNEVSGEVESVDISTKIQITVIPNVDEERIKEDISGTDISSAEDYLQNIPNITGGNITQKPARIFASTIPKNKDNITIVITAGNPEE